MQALKIAALQYQYDFPKDFNAYEKKISELVRLNVEQGISLLVFPEYAGAELLSFAPIEKLARLLPSYLELFQHLSQKHRLYICAGTQIVREGSHFYNRAHLFSPHGKIGHQDKCMLTPYEVNEGILSPGSGLNLFETEFGKIGIAICYDAEFPSLVKKIIDAGAKLILVPSYTSTVHGYYRVFLSCRARALENQCYVVQSPLVGKTDVEMAYGAACICSPVDEGFSQDGIIAIGKRDVGASLTALLDFEKLQSARHRGQTLNFKDAQKLDQRKCSLELFDLR